MAASVKLGRCHKKKPANSKINAINMQYMNKKMIRAFFRQITRVRNSANDRDVNGNICSCGDSRSCVVRDSAPERNESWWLT